MQVVTPYVFTPNPAAKLKPFARPGPNEVLGWVHDGGAGVPANKAYDDYVVQFEDRQGDLLTFHFLNINDGSDIPGSFTIDLTNVNLVWAHLPSTIPQGKPQPGADCGFLFLDRTWMPSWNDPQAAPMMQAAKASGGGTGKYPKAG